MAYSWLPRVCNVEVNHVLYWLHATLYSIGMYMCGCVPEWQTAHYVEDTQPMKRLSVKLQ